MLSPTITNDGDYGTEVQISPTQPTYPFGNDPTPDVFAQVHDRMMEIALAAFVPRIANRSSPINFLVYSEDFSNAAWTKSNVTVTPDAVANPADGLVTADQLAAMAADSYIGQAFTPPIVAPSSWSIWLRSAAGTVSVSLYAVRLSDGAFAGLVSINVTSTWTRFILPLTPLDLTAHRCQVGGGSTFSTGEIIYAWGSQLDASSVVGCYVPTTTIGRSVTVPDVDPDDPFAFLVAESKPQVSDGEIAQFTRTFARIPSDQVKPGSINFPRPVLHGIKNGTAYAVAFEDDQRLSWIFTFRIAVSSLAAPVVADDVETNTKALLPGGITINLAGHNGTSGTTGSFNTSDSIATIQTAVFNIWTHATVSVTKDDYGISVQSVYGGSGGGAITQVDGGASSAIQVSGSPLNFTIEASASGKTVSTPLDDSIRNVHAVSHGGVVGDRVALWRGDKLVAVGSVVTVPGADDFTVELDAIPGKNEVVTHCGFSTDAAMCIVNGPKMCDIRHTTRFYLPGYTAGITTDADIPKQAPQVDPISWLGVIIAGTAWPVYQVNEVSQWMGSILQQETITLQLADAVDTVTP